MMVNDAPNVSSSSSSSSAPLISGIVSINDPTLKIKLHACGWRRFLNGISNRYEDIYPEQLQDVIAVEEFERVVKKLHNRIASMGRIIYTTNTLKSSLIAYEQR